MRVLALTLYDYFLHTLLNFMGFNDDDVQILYAPPSELNIQPKPKKHKTKNKLKSN